jgi:hypothetical protein
MLKVPSGYRKTKPYLRLGSRVLECFHTISLNQRPPAELGVWGRPLEGACWWSLIYKGEPFLFIMSYMLLKFNHLAWIDNID